MLGIGANARSSGADTMNLLRPLDRLAGWWLDRRGREHHLHGKPVSVVLDGLRKDRETLLDAIGPLVGVYDACPRRMKEQVPSPIASRYGVLRRTYFKVAYQRAVKEEGERANPEERCHADSDGDCEWHGCPQLRDGEPAKSGRHCPLDKPDPEA
jgi:hypothetical protein